MEKRSVQVKVEKRRKEGREEEKKETDPTEKGLSNRKMAAKLTALGDQLTLH